MKKHPHKSHRYSAPSLTELLDHALGMRPAPAAPLTQVPETRLLRRITPPWQSATQSTGHLNSLGGRENTKFDHLDKTKDLSASLPPAKPSHALVLVVIEAHSGKVAICRRSQTILFGGRLTALTALTAHIIPSDNHSLRARKQSCILAIRWRGDPAGMFPPKRITERHRDPPRRLMALMALMAHIFPARSLATVRQE
jgi:hypothetical protein